MKNEVRINVYVSVDFSASTSRVDGGGRVAPQVAVPPAATRLIALSPLYILTGVLPPALRSQFPLICLREMKYTSWRLLMILAFQSIGKRGICTHAAIITRVYLCKASLLFTLILIKFSRPPFISLTNNRKSKKNLWNFFASSRG